MISWAKTDFSDTVEIHKAQSEKKFYAFNTVFSRKLQEGCKLIMSMIRILCRELEKRNKKQKLKQLLIQILLFDHVSTVYYGVLAGYAHTSMIT